MGLLSASASRTRLFRGVLFSLLAGAMLAAGSGCKTFDQALTSAGVPCGLYRWRIKTLSDADATAIRRQPIDARIRDLVSIDPPATFDRRRRNANEYYIYRVRAVLVKTRVGMDQDVHMLLRDPEDPEAHMVAEIPNPGCARATGMPSSFAAARHTVQTLRKHRRETLVEVVGVGFFDEYHETERRGRSPNRFELHPVLEIRELSRGETRTLSTSP